MSSHGLGSASRLPLRPAPSPRHPSPAAAPDSGVGSKGAEGCAGNHRAGLLGCIKNAGHLAANSSTLHQVSNATRARQCPSSPRSQQTSTRLVHRFLPAWLAHNAKRVVGPRMARGKSRQCFLADGMQQNQGTSPKSRIAFHNGNNIVIISFLSLQPVVCVVSSQPQQLTLLPL